MPARLSRRKLAIFAAEKLLAGTPQKTVIRELAAYLIDSGRTRETELLVRDIEDVLASRGVVVVDVVSARQLSVSAKAEVAALIGAKNLHLREQIDESVVGGVRVDLPGKRFDGTIRHKLNALRAKQV
jgi:F0F1-type ATP synthase delta subunit